MLRRSGLARAVRDLGVRQRVQETGRHWPLGAWSSSYLYGAVYGGGGFRSFVMDGQSVRCDDANSWEQMDTDASNWKTTPEGGPFVELDGVSEYLRLAESARNRPGANNLLVVTAYRPDSVSGAGTIIGKWNEENDDRAWRLRRNGASVEISTCATGLSADVVTLASSFILEAEAWHFIAGYWEAGTQLKLWVAKTTDESVTVDLLTTDISSTIYAATGAYVTIGAEDAPGTPAADVTTHDHSSVAEGGTVDHGVLTGKADDDHAQYLKERGSGGAATDVPTHDHSAVAEAGTVDHGALDGLGDDDHGEYLKEKGSGGVAAEVPTHDHSAAGEAGAVDHGDLDGLADDDHEQYVKERLSGGAAADVPTHDHSAAGEAGTVDHGDLDGLGDDDHAQYTLVNGTRAFTGSVEIGGDLEVEGGLVVGDLGQTPVTGAVTLKDVAVPGTPASGYGHMYVNADKIYLKDDGATIYDLTLGGWTPEMGDPLFTQDDGLLLLGPYSEINPTEWWSLRKQKATQSGAFHQEMGRWPATRALPVALAAANLVENPSLENNISDYWSNANWETAERSATHARFGTYSARLYDSSFGGDEVFFSTALFVVDPETDYTLTAWMTKTICTGTGRMLINWYTAGDVYISAGVLPFDAGTHDWKRYELTAESPATAGKARIYAFHFTGVTAATEFEAYVDGVQFEESAYATPYFDGSFGSGFAWTGDAHDSSSTRTITQLNLDALAGLITDNPTLSFRAVVQMPYDADDADWPAPPFVFDIRGADDNNRIYLTYSPTADEFYTYINGATRITNGSVQTFDKGDWLDLVLTVDFTADEYYLYVNGILDGTDITSLTAATGLTEWNIGATYLGASVSGLIIAEFAVLDRVLTANEIAALYAQSRPLVDLGAWDAPEAVAHGNTDGEIGGLTISGVYSAAEVQALRDKCEELADDVRSLRAALVACGLVGES